MQNPLKRQQSPQGRHTPKLWPVWLVAPIALVAVAGVAYLLYQGAEALLDQGTEKPVKVNDIVKTTATGFTLLGAVLTGVYAYRKQRLSEGDAHREDARHLAERYSIAAEQLGHEQAAVRLAGVYAMARLADDWPEQRQVCIDVLCAYIRMPYQTEPDEDDFKTGEREVRLTIIRIIRDHLQDPKSATSWCGYDFDFTGATFDGGDFSGAQFTGGKVRFIKAEFTDGILHFYDAKFTGGQVNFNFAQVTGGSVNFHGAKFTGGEINFNFAQVTGGEVSFHSAEFTGGEVTFCGAKFTGGVVIFICAQFTGGEVNFHGAQLCTGGEVTFYGAEFTGGEINFRDAEFTGGEVNFSDTRWLENGATVGFESVRVSNSSRVVWGPFPVIAPESE